MVTKRTTIKDVANLAGVSFALVSKYINNHPAARMTYETRARIDAAIKELDYRPSTMAQALRSGHTHTVGMICGGLTNSFFAHAANCALMEFQRRGYQLLLALSDSTDHLSALRMLTEHNVDGIYGFSLPDLSSTRLSMNCPILLNHVHIPGISDVSIDALEALTQGLMTLKVSEIEGLFVKPTYWISQFRKASEAAGCKGHVRSLPIDVNERRKAIREICMRRPKAIFTNGWETMVCLQEVLDDEFPKYSPKLLLHANCSGPFLKDSRIIGVITSSTRQLIRQSCEALIAQIEGHETKSIHNTIPSRFILSSSPDYSALLTRYFQLT